MPISSRRSTLSKRLAADRPLDQRPYRGDYDRVGQTTARRVGRLRFGRGELFGGDTKLFGLASYDQYERYHGPGHRLHARAPVRDDPGRQGVADVRRAAARRRARRRSRSSGTSAATTCEEHLDNNGPVCSPPAPNTVIEVQRIYNQDIDSYGIWGEFGWDFADDFTLEGGVRYNWERKKFDFQDRSAGPRRSPTVRVSTSEHDLADSDRPDHPDLSHRRGQAGLRALHARLQGRALQRARVADRDHDDEPFLSSRQRGVQRRLGGRPARGVARAAALASGRRSSTTATRTTRSSCSPTAQTRPSRRCSRSSTRSRPRTTVSSSKGSAAAARGLGAAPARGAAAVGQLRLAARRVHRLHDLPQFGVEPGDRRSRSTTRASSSRTRRSTR